MADSVYMPCSAIFSLTLQTEIFSTETSDFHKQINFLLSCHSVLITFQNYPSLKASTTDLICSYSFHCVGVLNLGLKNSVCASRLPRSTNLKIAVLFKPRV